MKRSLLISGATMGGIGAGLLAVHPAFGNDKLHSTHHTLSRSSSPTPEATKSSSVESKLSARTEKPKSKATAKTKSPAVHKLETRTPALKKISGTFTGEVVDVAYGQVQVKITVTDGRIVDAQALQAPSGRSYRYSEYALPILRDQTLAAQSANIDGATGASYTSYGWYTSLQSALAKAGL